MGTTTGIAEQALSMDNKQSIGRALGRIASGVYVLTIKHDGQAEGLMVSWVNQAAFEPPMISVAVKKTRHLLELLAVGQKFTINILCRENTDIFKNFAARLQPGMDRFAGLQLASVGNAGPVLASALAFLDCQSRSMVEAGDHILVIAEVIYGSLLDCQSEPMIHLRKNGFQY